MAKGPLRDAVVVVNGVTLTTYNNAVQVQATRPEIDVTGMGATFMEIVPGIPDGTITLSMFQDYAVGAVDATIWPLMSSSAGVLVQVKVASGAISTSNPEYQMTGNVYDYSPINGGVGEANQTEVVFRNASQTGIVRDVTP